MKNFRLRCISNSHDVFCVWLDRSSYSWYLTGHMSGGFSWLYYYTHRKLLWKAMKDKKYLDKNQVRCKKRRILIKNRFLIITLRIPNTDSNYVSPAGSHRLLLCRWDWAYGCAIASYPFLLLQKNVDGCNHINFLSWQPRIFCCFFAPTY